METSPVTPKSECLRWQWTRITCSLGFAFLLASIISGILMPMYVRYKIMTNLPLIEGSISFETWKEPPLTPLSLIYLFNCTNVDEFLSGREKANLTQVGPYTYRIKMKKTNVSISEDGEELTHKVYREFYFEPSLSVGSDTNDKVFVPNIPLFGLQRKMEADQGFAKSMAIDLVRSYDYGIDTGPFVHVSVHEFLWGYPSILMSMARSQSEECADSHEYDVFNSFDFDEDEGRKSNCDISPDNLAQFGLFSTRNATFVDERTLKTGKHYPSEKGQMVAWKGQKKVDYWTKDECNMVEGRDPSGLPLDVSKNDTIRLFIGQLCRPLNFYYAKTVQNGEFSSMRFVPDESSFTEPAEKPENRCYCLDSPCLPTGMLDISGCQPQSPIYLSWPHFLHGDPWLRTQVHGMDPSVEKHSFAIDIMDKYGIALSAMARFQMNVIVKKDPDFGLFNNIAQEKVYLPFMWLEEGIMGLSDVMIDDVRYVQNLPGQISKLMSTSLFIVGLGLFVPEIVLWSRSCFGRKKYHQTELIIMSH